MHHFHERRAFPRVPPICQLVTYRLSVSTGTWLVDLGVYMNEPPARRRASPTSHRAADLFALVADIIEFLGRSAWPIVDLVIRLWLAKQAIMSGLLLAHDWNTALTLAANEYPVPWLGPGVTRRAIATAGSAISTAVGKASSR
jgi:hypothetical protein